MKHSCGHATKLMGNLTVDFPCVKCKIRYLRDKLDAFGALYFTPSEEKAWAALFNTDLPIDAEDASDIPFLTEHPFADNDFPHSITIPFDRDRVFNAMFPECS